MLVNGISNISQGIPFWYGAGKAGFMGAVSGAISFGIGSIATETFQATMSVCKSLFEAGLHGITSGVMSEIQGGNFGSGFAAGAVSSLVSSGVQSLGETGGIKNAFGSSPEYKAVLIASGGLSGGLSSSIAGGNFWDGVKQGLITSGLNHLAHEVASGFGSNDQQRPNEALAKEIALEGYYNVAEVEAFLDSHPFNPTHRGVEMGGVEINSSKQIDDQQSIVDFSQDEIFSQIKGKLLELFSPRLAKIADVGGAIMSVQKVHAPDSNYFELSAQRSNVCKQALINHFFQKPTTPVIPTMHNGYQKYQVHASRFDKINGRNY